MTPEEKKEARRIRRNETKRIWRASNPEKVNIYYKKYRLANREKRKAASRTWCIKNPEKRKAVTRAWYMANREKCKAATRAWNFANQERRNETWKKYRDSHVEQIRKKIYLYQVLGTSKLPPELKEAALALRDLRKAIKNGNRPN